MNNNTIGSELSYLVFLKQQRERDGKDEPKVKAPVVVPAKFDAIADVTKRGAQ